MKNMYGLRKLLCDEFNFLCICCEAVVKKDCKPVMQVLVAGVFGRGKDINNI